MVPHSLQRILGYQAELWAGAQHLSHLPGNAAIGYCPQRQEECQLLGGITKVILGEGQFLSTSVGLHISLPGALTVWPLSWAHGLPVEEAGLTPEHHHHIAACIQVGACDGNLCPPRHGSSVGLQICEGQSLCRKKED